MRDAIFFGRTQKSGFPDVVIIQRIVPTHVRYEMIRCSIPRIDILTARAIAATGRQQRDHDRHCKNGSADESDSICDSFAHISN